VTDKIFALMEAGDGAAIERIRDTRAVLRWYVPQLRQEIGDDETRLRLDPETPGAIANVIRWLFARWFPLGTIDEFLANPVVDCTDPAVQRWAAQNWPAEWAVGPFALADHDDPRRMAHRLEHGVSPGWPYEDLPKVGDDE
jgi:hypothetical protein